jgi:ATP adenylyltransferase
VSFDDLWAGWRSSYVTSLEDATAPGAKAAEAESPCIFCGIAASCEPDEARHVVWTGERTVAILNAFPYSSGHVMVLPIRHVRELRELEADEVAELCAGVCSAVEAVKAAYSPEGMNLGLNLGRAAGAGIPGHLHVHIVPRWIGDTNFMTAVAGVRVLPEALGDTWSKLRAAWK